MSGTSVSRESLLARLNGDVASGFASVLGVRFIDASLDHVVAEVKVAPDHISRPGVVHGGVLMAIADTVGGFATRINLPPGRRTTTIESKTNFFRAMAPSGVLTARGDVIHRGRTLMVWQTEILDGEGRKVAITTQTQLILAEVA